MSPTYCKGLAVGLIFIVCLHENISPTAGLASFCKLHLMASVQLIISNMASKIRTTYLKQKIFFTRSY